MGGGYTCSYAGGFTTGPYHISFTGIYIPDYEMLKIFLMLEHGSRATLTRWLAKDFGVENIEEEVAKVGTQKVINPFGGF